MSEHIKAREWRERRGLSLQKLAELSGYSVSSLSWFERGLTPTRPGEKQTKVRWFVWQRYKLIMAAVDRELATGRKFEW